MLWHCFGNTTILKKIDLETLIFQLNLCHKIVSTRLLLYNQILKIIYFLKNYFSLNSLFKKNLFSYK